MDWHGDIEAPSLVSYIDSGSSAFYRCAWTQDHKGGRSCDDVDHNVGTRTRFSAAIITESALPMTEDEFRWFFKASGARVMAGVATEEFAKEFSNRVTPPRWRNNPRARES